MLLRKAARRLPLWLKIVVGISASGLALLAASLAFITFWPDVAAQNIDRLRDVIGDEAVAQIESVVLNIQDNVQQWEYQVGLRKPAAPWEAARSAESTSPAHPTNADSVRATLVTPVTESREVSNGVASVPTGISSATSTPSVYPTAAPTTIPGTEPTGIRPATSTPSVYPTAAPTATIPSMPTTTSAPAWQPAPVIPLGKLAGEGQWSPYLQAVNGQPVAYRTFLQPDPRRPYSIPAIVAFDLQATRLHFVIGTVEPRSSTPRPPGTGLIPAADREPGVLLATFNGGFKARHGEYGAMAGGFTALPPINGLATVAMYADGRVQIGQWGKDIKGTPGLVAWRQNGEMIIHNGQINPDTASGAVPWGKTIKGESITWRSALGLSADRRTLYYVAGLQLDVPTLAKVMAQVGATEALQLDVNEFWVHFAAIRSDGSILVAEPLLEAMRPQVDRYLKESSRDFFYVTTASH
jgi:Phosphodiester glycosidase